VCEELKGKFPKDLEELSEFETAQIVRLLPTDWNGRNVRSENREMRCLNLNRSEKRSWTPSKSQTRSRIYLLWNNKLYEGDSFPSRTQPMHR
jgi:hypothetical protein